MRTISLAYVILCLPCFACAGTGVGQTGLAKDTRYYFTEPADKRGVLVTATGMCSEAPPDVVTEETKSAKANVDAEILKQALKSTASFDETVKAIDLSHRTERISMIRDLGYRICELYVSGGLTPEQAGSLLGQVIKLAENDSTPTEPKGKQQEVVPQQKEAMPKPSADNDHEKDGHGVEKVAGKESNGVQKRTASTQ